MRNCTFIWILFHTPPCWLGILQQTFKIKKIMLKTDRHLQICEQVSQQRRSAFAFPFIRATSPEVWSVRRPGVNSFCPLLCFLQSLQPSEPHCARCEAGGTSPMLRSH